MLRKKFTLKELIYISLLATIATISKTPIRVLSNFLTNSFGLPGGVIGGVYYMFWIVAACGFIKKCGTATLFCIIQIFVSFVIFTMPPIKLITYLPPGMVIDLFLLLWRKDPLQKGIMGILGALANSAGAITQAKLFMGLPMIPTLISGISAAVSGAIGGYLAFILVIKLNKEEKAITF
ncbi:ECF transporter S component [Garciella nitratireducens]|uniref:Energy-coupling factor transport system substrate-specific component n=1 Tax=Garciella nitratireducens DSM 15102 TaxID=1121911 RepID=A0A1T4NH31_9FIRM|nr:ECF transporter S component [Garciella nitratireducens]SJZ78337.1 energy-coupling factor transport system substrate-specific component [Garciella nitratireducens DSM 15102]